MVYFFNNMVDILHYVSLVTQKVRSSHPLQLRHDKQESPPAWTQEAYRPPCSDYSFCCPNWVPPPPWPGRGGYHTWVPPQQGTPSRVPPGRVLLPSRVPPTGYPPAGYPPTGYPPVGYPWQGTPPGWTWQGTPPVSAPWHSGKCCKALWDMGTPPVDRQSDGWMEGQTRVKTLPSRRTTYVGGNYKLLHFQTLFWTI